VSSRRYVTAESVPKPVPKASSLEELQTPLREKNPPFAAVSFFLGDGIDY
jgi:hypothetical protein